MTRRRLAATGLLALACASQPPPPPLPPCAAGTAGVPLAFELRAPNGQQAFLQGSVHFAREREAGLGSRAQQALAEADVLVGELDMENVSQEKVAREVFEMGQLPEGRTLRDVLSPETWSLLEQRAQESNIPLDPLLGMKPWVLAMTFIGPALGQLGMTREQGVELQVYAARRPKATRGLEKISDQLALFDNMSYPAQDRMLRDMLEPADPGALDLESMFAAWRCGDAAGLESVLDGMQSADPELLPFYEATIFQRNASMAKGVQTVVAESQRAFIVVGALHLVGARGIPALLEQQGFQVEQVRAAAPPEATAPPAAP